MGDRQQPSKRDTLTKTDTESNPTSTRVYKILLVGDIGVGKSGLLLRFADDTFMETYNSTLGVEFKFRTVNLNRKPVKLQIWDTSGQERFRAITANYYRNIHGIIIVYDVTNQVSFDNVTKWLEEIHRNADDDVNKMILGNKCDLQDNIVVESDTAEAYAVHLGCSFFQTSAKDDTNVEQAFMSIATDIDNRLSPPSVTEKCDNIKMKSQDVTAKSGKRCC